MLSYRGSWSPILYGRYSPNWPKQDWRRFENLLGYSAFPKIQTIMPCGHTTAITTKECLSPLTRNTHGLARVLKATLGLINCLTQVSYTEVRPRFKAPSRDDYSIFYSKSPSWGHEREWRMVKSFPKTRSHHDHHLFEFPRETIKNVTLGCWMPKNDKQHIIRTIRSSPNFQAPAYIPGVCPQNEIRTGRRRDTLTVGYPT